MLVPARETEIFRVTDDLAEVMGAQDFSPDAIREISAAVKEVMENIVRHGYRGRPGSIGIRCTASHEKVTVEISDSAPAFDPLKGSGPHKRTGETVSGGLGLAFVQQAADIVTYRHRDHRNILTLVKIRRG